MKAPDYTNYLTPTDRVRVAFRQNRGNVEHFVVNYQALIDGRWRTVMRIDTCHGYAHKHTFYRNGRQYVIKWDGRVSDVFTESVAFVKRNFARIKDNYLRNA